MQPSARLVPAIWPVREGHPRRFRVTHGATATGLDLCSRRSSARGHLLSQSNVGLEVMPVDGVALSDGRGAGVRAPTCSRQLRGSLRASGKAPGMGVRIWRRLTCQTVGTGAAGASVRGMEQSVYNAVGGSAALVRLAA
jgi:hypothetical protein